MHAGSVYVTRGSHKDASRVATAALAVDPSSAHAQQFQRRAQEAAMVSNRWWTVARGRFR